MTSNQNLQSLWRHSQLAQSSVWTSQVQEKAKLCCPLTNHCLSIGGRDKNNILGLCVERLREGVRGHVIDVRVCICSFRDHGDDVSPPPHPLLRWRLSYGAEVWKEVKNRIQADWNRQRKVWNVMCSRASSAGLNILRTVHLPVNMIIKLLSS